VCVLQRTAHYIQFARDRYEMNVIRHQTVADQCQAVQLNALSQQIEIDRSIGIGIKNELSCIASLSYVVWHANGNHTGQTRHPSHPILNDDLVDA
jgi:hypothetical protein